MLMVSENFTWQVLQEQEQHRPIVMIKLHHQQLPVPAHPAQAQVLQSARSFHQAVSLAHRAAAHHQAARQAAARHRVAVNRQVAVRHHQVARQAAVHHQAAQVRVQTLLNNS